MLKPNNAMAVWTWFTRLTFWVVIGVALMVLYAKYVGYQPGSIFV
jgi:cytochrome b